MKFHTTASTRLISLMILILLSLVVVLLPLSIQIFPIDTPFIVDAIATIESDLDVQLEVDSIESNIFQRIGVHGVRLLDKNNNKIVTIDSITIQLPWYRLLPKYFFTQTLPLTIEGVAVNLKTEIIDTFLNMNSSSNAKDNALNLTFVIDELKLEGIYNSHQLSSHISTLSGTIENNQIQKINLDADTLHYKSVENELYLSSLTSKVTRKIGGDLEATVIGQQVEGTLQSPENTTFSVDSFTISYNTSTMGESGSLNLSTTQLMGSTTINQSILSSQINSLNLSAVYNQKSIDKITLNSGQFLVDYDQLTLSSDKLKLNYLKSDQKGTLAFGPVLSLLEQKKSIVNGKNVLLSLNQSSSRNSIKLVSSALEVKDIKFVQDLLSTTWLDSLTLDNPYLLLSQEIGSNTIIFETSSSINSDLSYEVSQHISTQFYGDGSIDIDSKNLDTLHIKLAELDSSLLPKNLELNFTLNSHDMTYPLSLSFKDEQHIVGEYKFNKVSERGEFSLNVNKTELNDYQTVIDLFAPSLTTSIGEKTTLSGSINGEIDNYFTFGKANASLAVANIIVGDKLFNGAATLLTTINPETFIIDLATLTTEGFRISYAGSIDRRTLYPKGLLEANEVESGRSLLAASFVQSQTQEVGYSISSSLVPSLKISGVGNSQLLQMIETTGELEFNGNIYPLHSLYDSKRGTIDFSLPNISLLIDFMSNPSHISFNLEATDFVVPIEQEPAVTLSGTVAGDVSLSDGVYLFTGENIVLDNLQFLQVKSGTISTSFITDRTQFIIENLSYEDEFGKLVGKGEISNNPFINLFKGQLNTPKTKFTLRGEDEELITITLIPEVDNSQMAIGVFEIQNTPLERFSPLLTNVKGSLLFSGLSDANTFIDGEGTVSLYDINDESIQVTADISFLEDGIFVSNGEYKNNNISVENGEINLPFNGNLSASLEFIGKKESVYRDATTHASLSIGATIDPSEGIFPWMSSIGSKIQQVNEISLTNSDTLFLGMVEQPNGTHIIHFEDDLITIKKGKDGYIEGSYDTQTHKVQFEANENFLFPMKGSGYVDSQRISIALNPVVIDFTYLNALFGEPSIIFNEGILTGDVLIDGDLLNPQFYGTLNSNVVSVSLFWVPGQVISVKNPVVTLSENTFTIPFTQTIDTKDNGETAGGLFAVEAIFEKWNLQNYQLEAKIDKGSVSVYVPVPAIDMVIDAEAQGTFKMIGSLTEELLLGDIYVVSAKVGFGVPELPEWFNPKTRTSINMNFTSGKNVSFVYPNEQSPIVSATVADNQKFSISLTAPAMTFAVEGDLALRSGEIYYVQENFYITEGSIAFPKVQNQNFESSEPKINLRARLRKFDSNSERIDIYLILQNTSFTNINPRFESIPSRPNNEILQLLGQNLLSRNVTDSQDAGFSSVISAASAATDVISRLGIIQGTGVSFGLTSIIRDSLGLDVFTIRSNLIQNLLLDAIPGLSVDTSSSPFSRYLDNTTLYLGKYLVDQLYLQGLLTFRRDTTGVRSSFLASDLAIDTELSIEWLNDLATFSFFTQPEELSIFNLFDTMGFSITKNFEF